MDSQQQAPGTVVVGIDGSDHSWSALRWAAGLVERIGGQLVTVHVWEVPHGFGMGLVSLPADAFQPPVDAEERGRALVEQALARTGLSVRPQVRVVQGYPAQVLLEESRGADLLVVGRRGTAGLASAVMGSVSGTLSGHAQVPVVIVPQHQD